MRRITDCAGIEWKIFEVRRPADDETRWTYLPELYGDGWLCFESRISKRRLAPIPANWRDLGDQALLHKLRDAQPVLRRAAESDAVQELEL